MSLWLLFILQSVSRITRCTSAVCLWCEDSDGKDNLHVFSPPPLTSTGVTSLHKRWTNVKKCFVIVFAQSTCTFPQPQQPASISREMAHSSREASAPAGFPRRGRGSSCSLASKSSRGVSSQNRGGETEMLERLLNKPKLVVLEEPKERGMRFRYECEGRSAGSILGASSTETNKSQPAIEVDALKFIIITHFTWWSLKGFSSFRLHLESWKNVLTTVDLVWCAHMNPCADGLKGCGVVGVN